MSDISSFSKISKTDLALFQNLSNPENVDLNKFKKVMDSKFNTAEQKQKDNGNEVDAKLTHEELSPHHTNQDVRTGGDDKSFFQQAVMKCMNEDERENIDIIDDDEDIESIKSFLYAPSHAYGPKKGTNDNGPSFDHQEDPLSPSAASVCSIEYPPSHTRNRESSKNRREKQRYLLLLRKFEYQGIKLTREFSMSDPLDDIRYEAEQHQANLDSVSTVMMMREGLKTFLKLMIAGNNRFGPFLHLEHLGKSLDELSKLDPTFERLYFQFFRKTERTPVMEILMTVGGMILMSQVHGMAAKFLGGKGLDSSTSASNLFGSFASAFSSKPKSANNSKTHSTSISVPDSPEPPQKSNAPRTRRSELKPLRPFKPPVSKPPRSCPPPPLPVQPRRVHMMDTRRRARSPPIQYLAKPRNFRQPVPPRSLTRDQLIDSTTFIPVRQPEKPPVPLFNENLTNRQKKHADEKAGIPEEDDSSVIIDIKQESLSTDEDDDDCDSVQSVQSDDSVPSVQSNDSYPSPSTFTYEFGERVYCANPPESPIQSNNNWLDGQTVVEATIA